MSTISRVKKIKQMDNFGMLRIEIKLEISPWKAITTQSQEILHGDTGIY